jgi:hypothetical protein
MPPAPPCFDRAPAVRLLLRPPPRLDAFRPDDLRPPPFEPRDDPPRDEPRDEERDDDPPRLRAADFRPRFAPPDRRDELLLRDFLRDPRLEVAIPDSPDGRSYRAP